jgi:hypothetical protein
MLDLDRARGDAQAGDGGGRVEDSEEEEHGDEEV